MNLRKQLIERSLSHKPNKTIQATHPPGTRSHDPAQLLSTDHDGVDGEAGERVGAEMPGGEKTVRTGTERQGEHEKRTTASSGTSMLWTVLLLCVCSLVP